MQAFCGAPSTGKAEFYYDGMFREPRVKITAGTGGVRKGGNVGIDFAGKSLSKTLLKHGYWGWGLRGYGSRVTGHGSRVRVYG